MIVGGIAADTGIDTGVDMEGNEQVGFIFLCHIDTSLQFLYIRCIRSIDIDVSRTRHIDDGAFVFQVRFHHL